MSVIKKITSEEGFRSKPYECTEGVWTFGHGFTSISEDESRVVLKIKVEKILSYLNHKNNHLPYRYKKLPLKAREVICDMTYQLGRTGMLNFRRMHKAIANKDWNKASEELLDSLYAKQTPSRANRNAEMLRKCKFK